ncbi:hypothetical protein KY362_05135 [Candidatus Woesearchaeota archaeon]|nr:hypothetical protein [Candidatus Woesearchaeota archaeon]
MAFCPRCGKKGIKGRFCDDCAASELDVSFKDMTLKKCVECSRFMVKHQWREFPDSGEGIVAAAMARVKNPAGLTIHFFPVYKKLMDKPGVKQQIVLETEVEGQRFEIPATIDFTYCPNCSKKGTEYFEGVLQLRDIDQDVEDYVRSEIAANEKDGVFLVKERKLKNGYDFKLTSNKFIRALGKRLVARFTGELSESAKLFTRNKQTSKDVFRINVLFRQRHFKVGDVVESRGRKVRVTTIGKRVSGVDVETGKKVFVEEN